jgi:hypothetical protein
LLSTSVTCTSYHSKDAGSLEATLLVTFAAICKFTDSDPADLNGEKRYSWLMVPGSNSDSLKEEFCRWSFKFIFLFFRHLTARGEWKLIIFIFWYFRNYVLWKIIIAACYLLFPLDPEDRDRKFLWNYNKYLPFTLYHITKGSTLYQNCAF